ncbi:MAG: class II aldolase/adducin family protein, partial [Armatimonadota bacterium]|nr:class II aldolase/adducin family protein [Armatimonadota bacterium]
MQEQIKALLGLSHELGREERQLAILGEGNTSTRLDASAFAVKASGSNLATLRDQDVAVCRFDALLPLLEQSSLSDAAVDDALFAARVNAEAKKPSVEALFHAYLLTLPEVQFVGHTHAVTVNQILCSPRAREFAENRLFPDEIVCCGVASVFVPYTDPGLKLAQAIRTATEAFIQTYERRPSVILLENHGLITLGK